MFDVADDAHDLVPVRLGLAEGDPCANRRAGRKMLECKRLVDHGDTRSTQRVARREFSAPAHRDLHRGEIPVADNSQLLFRLILWPAHFASFDVERSASAVATE